MQACARQRWKKISWSHGQNGKHLHALKSNLQQIGHRISRDQRRLEKIEKDIVIKGARIVASDDTTLEERLLILADLKRLTEEKGQLEKAVVDMEYERGRAEIELEHYRSDIALQYGL